MADLHKSTPWSSYNTAYLPAPARLHCSLPSSQVSYLLVIICCHYLRIIIIVNISSTLWQLWTYVDFWKFLRFYHGLWTYVDFWNFVIGADEITICHACHYLRIIIIVNISSTLWHSPVVDIWNFLRFGNSPQCDLEILFVIIRELLL